MAGVTAYFKPDFVSKLSRKKKHIFERIDGCSETFAYFDSKIYS